MTARETERSYRRLAIEGASPIGLLIVLLDLLAADLRRAVLALHQNDIESRTRELNHAFLVLGQLQSWVDLDRGGESARLLTRFYADLRAGILQAAVKKSARILEGHIETIQNVRNAWQKLDSIPLDTAARRSDLPLNTISPPSPSTPEARLERVPFSQSA